MASFVSSHGDAIIAAAAALVGVMSQIPLSSWSSRRERRRSREEWLRDKQITACAEALSAARAVVGAAFEHSYETWRTTSPSPLPSSYAPDPSVETALTDFIGKLDIARLLPGMPTAALDNLDNATRALAVSVRVKDFGDETRRRQRGQHKEAVNDLINEMSWRVKSSTGL